MESTKNRTPVTEEVLHERVTTQRPPSPPRRQISRQEKEQAINQLGTEMRRMDTVQPTPALDNQRETERLRETVCKYPSA